MKICNLKQKLQKKIGDKRMTKKNQAIDKTNIEATQQILYLFSCLSMYFWWLCIPVGVFFAKMLLRFLWDVKFGYSEEATKFEKIFHLEFDITE